MDETASDKKRRIAEYFSEIAAPDYGVDARFFPAMGRRLVELTRLQSGARLLDVAAGRGAILFWAAEQTGSAAESPALIWPQQWYAKLLPRSNSLA